MRNCETCNHGRTRPTSSRPCAVCDDFSGWEPDGAYIAGFRAGREAAAGVCNNPDDGYCACRLEVQAIPDP